MGNIIAWFRRIEAWVNRKTAEHPAWNVLTWLGHASVGAFYALLFHGFGLTAMGPAAAFGAFTWHETKQLWHGHQYPGTWNRFWRWFDPVMDVVAPTVAAIVVAYLLA